MLMWIKSLDEQVVQQLLLTATQNPGAIHALHEMMTTTELIATAAIFLYLGIASPDGYTPDSPTIEERMIAEADAE